jgi:hypothetical protein
VLSNVGDPATSNDRFNYVAVNPLYWFLEQRAWIGGESSTAGGSCGEWGPRVR